MYSQDFVNIEYLKLNRWRIVPCLVKWNVWWFSSRDSGSALHKLIFSELIARSAAHLKQWADNAAIWWVVWHTHTVRFICTAHTKSVLRYEYSSVPSVFCINKSSCLLYIHTIKEIIGLLFFKKNRTVDVNRSQITEHGHFLISHRPNNYRPEGQDFLCVYANC